MKRALLIAGGTVGGLGAVLAVTPPQFTSSNESGLALGGDLAPAATTQSQAPTATQSAAPAATTTKAPTPKSTTATKSGNATSTQSATPSPTPTATPAATKSSGTKNISGTFTGDAIDVSYGIVQVQITVVNGKITDAQAVQAPSGRNDRWTQMAVPVMRQRTLAAQGSNITGVSGASYTSYGWWKSLVSALSKAGL